MITDPISIAGLIHQNYMTPLPAAQSVQSNGAIAVDLQGQLVYGFNDDGTPYYGGMGSATVWAALGVAGIIAAMILLNRGKKS